MYSLFTLANIRFQCEHEYILDPKSFYSYFDGYVYDQFLCSRQSSPKYIWRPVRFSPPPLTSLVLSVITQHVYYDLNDAKIYVIWNVPLRWFTDTRTGMRMYSRNSKLLDIIWRLMRQPSSKVSIMLPQNVNGLSVWLTDAICICISLSKWTDYTWARSSIFRCQAVEWIIQVINCGKRRCVLWLGQVLRSIN